MNKKFPYVWRTKADHHYHHHHHPKSEVRGSEMALLASPQNREIDFDFDSIVRAGETKLRGRVRMVLVTLGLGV